MALLMARFLRSSLLDSISLASSRLLHTTHQLQSEPLKKKKRVDPSMEQNRIKRKIRKIEKEIKRFTRQDRQLRPVAELEGDRQLMRNLSERQRPPVDVSENEIDRRELLLKEWTRHQYDVARKETLAFRRVQSAQKKALNWLYATNPELYKAAIQPCPTSLTMDNLACSVKTLPIGPLSGPFYSAPFDSFDDYDPPDGEFVDVTPVFDYHVELDKSLLAESSKKKKSVVVKPKLVESIEDE